MFNPFFWLFSLLCNLGFHAWHTSADGMHRRCGNCNRYEHNDNVPSDTIQRWVVDEGSDPME